MRFDTPPPEPLASAPGFLLSWNGQRIAHYFASSLDPLGLRPPLFGVMTLIDSAPGSTQRELVERSMIDASTMVALIDELEKRGFAERRPHEEDRRKHTIFLTAKGRKTLANAREAAMATAHEVLGPLSTAEVATLTKLLRKLAGVEG